MLSRSGASAVAFEVVGAGSEFRCFVVGVEECAAVDREAAAADAGGESVADCLEGGDAVVEVVAPGAGEAFPVAARRWVVGGERFECGADLLQGDPGGAAGLDERDSAEGGA